jgi:hypothetical protein
VQFLHDGLLVDTFLELEDFSLIKRGLGLLIGAMPSAPTHIIVASTICLARRKKGDMLLCPRFLFLGHVYKPAREILPTRMEEEVTGYPWPDSLIIMPS